MQENEKGSGKGIAEQNLRLINGKAQLFRITSNAMINVSVIWDKVFKSEPSKIYGI